MAYARFVRLQSPLDSIFSLAWVISSILIGLTLLGYTSAASYFAYQGNYPIIFFDEFRYVPTDTGYILWYKTNNHFTHKEIGNVPDAPFRNDDSNPDTLGSSMEGRLRSKIPLKNRKVSPKLLASLSG